MVFVDTGAWFTALIPTDEHWARADRWLRGNELPLVTIDYVVDELVTLLLRRGNRQRIAQVRRTLFEDHGVALENVTTTDFLQAGAVRDRFADKDWSFTDCTSKVVMERLGIRTAFSFDKHFRQFPAVTVLP